MNETLWVLTGMPIGILVWLLITLPGRRKQQRKVEQMIEAQVSPEPTPATQTVEQETEPEAERLANSSNPPVPKMASSPAQQFLLQAAEYAHRSSLETKEVNWDTEHPTYTELSDEQAEWYFYWRSQLRNGRFLPTSMSYIYLHAFEVIHGVGFATSHEAYNHLRKLQLAFHRINEPLDEDLCRWTLDMIAYYDLPLDPLSELEELLGVGLAAYDPALHLAAKKQVNASYIPEANIVYELVDYHPTNSAFYQELENTELVDNLFAESLQYTNEYVMQKHGTSLIELMSGGRFEPREREAFLGALFGFTPKIVHIADVPLLKDDTELTTQIRSALHFAENLAKERYGSMEPKAGIELEVGLLVHLQNRFSSVHAEQPSEDAPEPVPLIDQLENLLQVKDTEVAVPAGPWVTFMHALNELQQQALHSIFSNPAQFDTFARSHHMFPNVLIDEINEVAVDTVGDLIIDTQHTHPTIYSEHQRALEETLTVNKEFSGGSHGSS